MNDFFDTAIEYLKGVGPAKAEVLKKELGIYSFDDLIKHYPFRYIDRTKYYKINEINTDLPYIQVTGKLIEKSIIGERTGKRLVATIQDSTGFLELVWFQGLKWVDKNLTVGSEYVVFGKPNYYGSRVNIVHPEMELFSEHRKETASSLQPVYNSTEKLKNFFLDSKGILKLQRQLLSIAQSEIQENLPGYLLDKYKMLSKREALNQIHFPTDARSLQRAGARLKFEEFFLLQYKLLRNQKHRKLKSKGFVFSKVGTLFNHFYSEKLPFDLTDAQKRVLKEIRSDCNTGFQMNRLLQGDVGSGKTVVALMSMLLAIDNGAQACLMAPTEILARQHFQTINTLLEDMPVHVRLLTGSSKSKARKMLLEELAEGKVGILIGTHALIEQDVQFSNLGMVIIDEQHRFGVEQRAKLWKKNTSVPHVLVMTATPIPRTLAMTLYGDLDVSVIDELPAGRKPVQTIHWYESQRLRLFGFMKEEIKKGRQIYIVYPLIKESEKLDLKDLEEGYQSIIKTFPRPGYQVSIVHGKMKASDKDFEMQQFLKGNTHIMVATTVIEVGVNIPNASVMIIENAERFGLSQLHQLRGRVGRGSEQSYCILMSGNKISTDGKARLETMVRTNNGFEIAETDLQLRGPGDLQGTQQSGVLDLHIADLAKDQRILQEARICVQELIDKDMNLEQAEHQPLRIFLSKSFKKGRQWEQIS